MISKLHKSLGRLLLLPLLVTIALFVTPAQATLIIFNNQTSIPSLILTPNGKVVPGTELYIGLAGLPYDQGKVLVYDVEAKSMQLYSDTAGYYENLLATAGELDTFAYDPATQNVKGVYIPDNATLGNILSGGSLVIYDPTTVVDIILGPPTTPNPDRTPPVLFLPDNIVAVATSEQGRYVTFNVSATDNVDADPLVVCYPSSGSLFSIGTTIVSCIATDNAGNQRGGSFTITIEPLPDTTPPVLNLPADFTVTATSDLGAIVNYNVTATDDLDPAPLVTCLPASGSQFPIGMTTVNCSAADAAGNTGNGSFHVTVQPPPDQTPPSITISNPADGATLTLPDITVSGTATDDHGVTSVTVNGITATLVGDSYSASITLNEGLNNISAVASDAAGNTATSTITVTFEVPLTPISDLTARAKSGEVQLVWTPISGADFYNVYRSTTRGGPYNLIVSQHVTDYATYLDTGLTNGVTYYYVVTYNTNGRESTFSNEASATPTARTRTR